MQLESKISKIINELEFLDLVPDKAKWYACDDAPAEYQLYPQESVLTHKMVAKRLAEFRSGRFCTKLALAQLDIKQFPVLVGEQRQPLWPDNVVGSISHCPGICLAIAAMQSDIAGIGVDIESASEFDSEGLKLICSEAEIAHLQESQNPLLGAQIIFSIKESIYKCLFPSYQQWIDFLDVKVKLDWQQQSYSVKLINQKLSSFYPSLKLKGGWRLNAEFILSSCWY